MPTDDGLTELGRTMLGILQTRGDWVSRKELRRALGRVSLHAYHFQLLKSLAEKGVIEVRPFSPNKGALSYEYRVKPPAANRV